MDALPGEQEEAPIMGILLEIMVWEMLDEAAVSGIPKRATAGFAGEDTRVVGAEVKIRV